jgi:phenylacetaldehyde dehydrogenase
MNAQPTAPPAPDQSQARGYAAKPKRMLIDGKWVGALSGETFDSRDPSTEQVISQIPSGDSADVDLAVRSARRAFESGPWPKMSAKERGVLLWRLADLLERHLHELAALETLDFGAPFMFTQHMVHTGIDVLRYYAGMATKIYGITSEISGATAEFHTYTRSEPVGVAGLITPWNASLTVVCNKIGPAIAAGCTCVVKPAELTSLTPLRLGDLILEAGFPPGVINIVTGLGGKAGAAIAAHPGVDKISFTGSTLVGRSLVHASADNFRRLTLELGGKSPLIILDDADLDAAIPAATMAILANSGQVCFAGSRLYVQKKVYDKVIAGMATMAKQMTLGSGFDASTQMGPLVSKGQQDRVLGYIQAGADSGAEIVTGGKRPDRPGYFVAPTIFANAKPDAKIVREEIFGPVVVATPFEDVAEVLRVANDTQYGLGSGIFTRDVSKAHLIAKALRAGNVWINCYGRLDASVPFGGLRQSGWGREFGPEGIQAFLETKAVFASL